MDGKGPHKEIKSLDKLKREMFGDPNEVFEDAKKEFWDQAREAKNKKKAYKAGDVTVPGETASRTSEPIPTPAATVLVQVGAMETLRKDFEELKRFYDLVDRMKYGEYDAYLEVGRISKSDSEYREAARRNRASIDAILLCDYLHMFSMLEGTGYVTESLKISYHKKTVEELYEVIAIFDIPHETRRCCAAFVVDFEYPEILEGALEILESSNCLYSIAAVCGILYDVFKKKAGFMDVKGWKRFCKKTLNDFEEVRTKRKNKI